ncbi:hypothetical protein CPT_Mendera_204 [Stenotrophomonas phage Mendera]|uniref:Uncharacterized protein n=1 Tax=Stenotrophomonas phage Mendera TaxID=2650877 RepID=A0A5P8PL26_9CAUD|nr:head fiber protein [Stenotrophomonas phage Mendera]QFR56730.1 hypothetical protein CPT_Mendera_204 [Stenotrophomonas phage Mendera]
MAAETYDQIRARSPIDTLQGTELILVQDGGVTKGGFVSILKSYVLNGFTILADAISDATSVGKSLLKATDQAAARSAIGAAPVYTTVTQTEAEEGTATTVRSWTAQRVRQASEAAANALFKKGGPQSKTAAFPLDASMVKSQFVQYTGATAINVTLPATGTTFSTDMDPILVLNNASAAVNVTLKATSPVTLICKDASAVTAGEVVLPRYNSARVRMVSADKWLVEY